MTPEAWVALILGLVGIMGTIIWSVWYMSGQLSKSSTKFEMVGAQQAGEIKELKVAVEKMETAIAAIAVQDVKITALIERMNATDKRTDERFGTLERIMDEVRHGKGLVRNG